MSRRDFREQAFLLCRNGRGQMEAGPVVSGSYGNVRLPDQCPRGGTPVAVVHSHPPDDSIRASRRDLTVARAAGLQFVCVAHGGQVRCYRTGR